MIAAGDFLAAMIGHQGKAYSTVNRFGPWSYDCSGDIWAALAECGARWGPTVSSAMYEACFPIPLSVAVQTPASFIFMPTDPTRGQGDKGHIAAVLNPWGFTTEARGHAWGVGSWPIAGRGFSYRAGLCPLIDYKAGGGVAMPPVVITNPVIVSVASLVLLAIAHGKQALGPAGTGLTLSGRESSGDEVSAWQSALNLTANGNLTVDGDYGPSTARATGAFEHAYNYFAGQRVLNEYGLVDNGSGGAPFGPVRAAMVQALENVIKTHGG